MSSFDFNYAIILKDKFSAVGNTIRKNLDKMDASLKRSSDHTEKFGKKLEVLARKLVLPTVGLMLILREGLKAADKQIVAQKVLASTLGSHNRFLKPINEQSERLERTTRFTQEALEQSATSMAQFTHSGYIANKMMLPLANMAAGLHINLQSATLMFSKSLTSPVNELQRYGIVIQKGLTGVTKFRAILAAIQAKFGGEALQMGKVGLGPLIVAGHLVGAVWRDVGKATIPALQAFARWLTPLLIKLDKFVNTHKTLVKWLTIGLIAFTALSIVVAGLAMFIGALSLVFGMLSGAVAIFGATLEIAFAPFTLIAVAIEALVFLGFRLYQRFKLVRDIINEVGTVLKGVGVTIENVAKFIWKLLTALSKFLGIGKLFHIIAHGVKAVGHFLAGPTTTSGIPSDIARPVVGGTHHTVDVALTVHDPANLISNTKVSTKTRLEPSLSGFNMKSVLASANLEY